MSSKKTVEPVLAAGMNDFITKPIDPDRLYTILLKWLPALERTANVAKPETRVETADLHSRLAQVAGLDIRQGLSITRGRTEFYARLLSMFVDSHAPDSECLRMLACSDEPEALGQLVHTLKGSAGTVGALHLSAKAADLMTDLREHRPNLSGQVMSLADELEQLINGLRQALRKPIVPRTDRYQHHLTFPGRSLLACHAGKYDNQWVAGRTNLPRGLKNLADVPIR
jgi:two-component system sensor histidine kinase/response regulator